MSRVELYCIVFSDRQADLNYSFIVLYCMLVLVFLTSGYSDAQSTLMSKITNDGLTRSGRGCFIAVPIWQQWASKGYNDTHLWQVVSSHLESRWCPFKDVPQSVVEVVRDAVQRSFQLTVEVDRTLVSPTHSHRLHYFTHHYTSFLY